MSSSIKRPAAYRLVVADELGVLKVIEVPAGPKWADAAVVQTWGQPNKEQGITCLACSSRCLGPGTPGLLAVGRKGRRVELLDAATGTQQASLTLAAATAQQQPAAAGQVQVAAVAFMQQADNRPLQLVAATSDGTVSICTCSSSSNGSPADGPSSSWSVSRSFQAGSSITCMAVLSSGSHLIVGGEGVQPSVWDIAAGTKLWQAKGSKPHRQTLLVDKPFTTAVAFLPSSSSVSKDGETNQPLIAAADGEDEAAAVSVRFVAGSVSSKLHVYDTAAGRRPQSEVVFGETRITAVAPERDGLRVWAANGTGHMQVWDLCAKKMLDALKGAGGSVRSLALHPAGEPLIASVGLDRFVRVHSTASKSGLGRVYLKQQLTGVCWLPVLQPAGTAAEAACAEDAATDTAAAAAGKPSKKKRKNKHEAVAAAGQEPNAGGSRKKQKGKIAA